MSDAKLFHAGDLVEAYGQRGVCRVVRIAARKRDALDEWLGMDEAPRLCVVERCFDDQWKARSDLAAVDVSLCNAPAAAVARKAKGLLAKEDRAPVRDDRLASSLATLTNVHLTCTKKEAATILKRLQAISFPLSANQVLPPLRKVIDLERMRAAGFRYSHMLQIANSGFLCGKDGVRLISAVRLLAR